MFKKGLLFAGLLMASLISPTEKISLSANSSLTVDYTFTGDEANMPGFAQGIITITPSLTTPVDGYYLVYFANENGLLENYDELASIKITGNTVKHEIKDGVMFPTNASKIAVFQSPHRFLDNPPSIDTAVSIIDLPESKKIDLGEVEMSFGAISDVHMNYEIHNRGAFKKWEEALDFFYDENMDYVIVPGDMTGDSSVEKNLVNEYKQYVATINNSKIPFDRVFESIGNHGNTPEDIGLFTQYTSGKNEVHPYEGSPYYYVLVEKEDSFSRDNLFIFMAQELTYPGETASIDNFSKEQMDFVESVLKEYGNTPTNIFLIEHSPFRNFGPGDRYNGGYGGSLRLNEEFTQNLRFKALLEEYKDVIMMSGHTHLSLYDNENYSDENNTCCRMIHLGSGCQQTSYGTGDKLVRNTDGRYEVTPNYGSEAYTVHIYKDYIVYTGYNLSTKKIIPYACFILPIHSPATPKVDYNEIEKLLDGNGTIDEPYLINNEEEFKVLTDYFNKCSSENKEEMFGNNKYFLQTADLNMVNYEGYKGVFNSKTFAGNYNGNGHSITIYIDSIGYRSVFPNIYGTLSNVELIGVINTTTSAQPVYGVNGSIINCVFNVSLQADVTNGIAHEVNGSIYNVYTTGDLFATSKCNVIASKLNIANHKNIYHDRWDLYGETVNDENATYSTDLAKVSEIIASSYDEIVLLNNGYNVNALKVENGELVIESLSNDQIKVDINNNNNDDNQNNNTDNNDDDKKQETPPNNITLYIIIGVTLLVITGLVFFILRKHK